MSSLVYSEYVTVPSKLDKTLKQCFINHLVIYNYSLSLLHDHEELTFKELMKLVTYHLTIKKITPIVKIALMNELYYQFKKFKRNIRMQKLVTDIQYFTFIGKGYRGDSLTIAKDKLSLKVSNFDESITFEKPLEGLEENKIVYYNLSYSNTEDKYKLSIHLAN